ncbi:MAG: hypothetical protein QNL59_07775 [Actinomycetota bacterium]
MGAPVAKFENVVKSDDAGRLTKNERKWARIGTLVAVLAFWLIATCLQPWHLFDKGPYTTDFYDAQARSLVHGHLDVPANVAGIEGFEIDGKTQIYFGIGPAIMRLPFSIVSEVVPRLPFSNRSLEFDRRLSLLSELIALSVLGLAAARLLKRAKSLVANAPEGAAWWFGAFAVVATLGTPLLFFSSRALVYHEAELWGAAAGLAGLDLVIRWWRVPTRRHLIEAVALATFALSCRPSTGAAPAMALGLFGLALACKREWRRSLLVLAGAVIPFLGFVLVNWLRFRSVSDVPFPFQVFSKFNTDRQAALAANNGSLFGLKFVPTNVARYFSPFAFQWDRLFPFVTWPAKATVIGNARFDTIDHTGSFLTSAPLLFLFGLVGAWWTIVRDKTRQWSAIAVAAIVATTSTFTFGYLAHRYLADLVPVFVVLAAPGVWIVARQAKTWRRWIRRTVVVAVSLLFAFGFWNQLGLAISTRAFSILPSESGARSFAEFQYELDDMYFGGTAPAVIQSEDGQLPSGVAPGTIVIMGDCDAVYRTDGYGWGPLERRIGTIYAYRLTGTIGSADQVILSNPEWALHASKTNEGVVFRWDYGNGNFEVSEPVKVDYGPSTFDVVFDPLPLGTGRVVANGTSVVGALVRNTSDSVVNPELKSAARSSASFCQKLLARLPNDSRPS